MLRTTLIAEVFLKIERQDYILYLKYYLFGAYIQSFGQGL